MMSRQLSVSLAIVVAVSLSSCAAPIVTDGASGTASPTPVVEQSDIAVGFIASLEEVGGTEWTGLDDTFNDRITFIFGADGSLSYRNAEGTFADPADRWSVDAGVLIFQATYGGSFGVGTHTANYDASIGVMTVEYTTSTNRSSSYTLSQIN